MEIKKIDINENLKKKTILMGMRKTILNVKKKSILTE